MREDIAGKALATAAAFGALAAITTFAAPISANAVAAEPLPLASVVDEAHVTLYDGQDRIIDTNDPTLSRDRAYTDGARLKLGQAVTVKVAMPDIVEHDGATGIQDGVQYRLRLPGELVPSAETEDGKALIDPDEPVVFFQEGKVVATGGIYAEGGGYELHVTFSDVEDALDVSGEFQYDAKVSDGAGYDADVSADFGPAGTVSFKTEQEPSVVKPDEYALIARNEGKSSSRAYAMNWSVTLKDRLEEYSLPSDTDISLSFTGGHTLCISVPNSMSDYSLTYVRADGTSKTVTAQLRAYPSFVSDDGSVLAELRYDPADAVFDLSKSDRYSTTAQKYLLEKATLHLNDVSGIKSITLNFPTSPYNNYGAMFNGGSDVSTYLFTATAQVPVNAGTKTVSMTAGNILYISDPSINGISVSRHELDSETYGSINDLPYYINTSMYLNPGNSSVACFEYTPSYENTANSWYSICPYAWYHRGALVGSMNRLTEDFLSELQVPFNSGWSYAYPHLDAVTIATGMGSTPAADDPETAYKMMRIFQDYYNGAPGYRSLSIFISNNKVNGKYVYVCIDSESLDKAQWSLSNYSGWGEWNAKEQYLTPKPWKVWIFNLPEGTATKMGFNEHQVRVVIPGQESEDGEYSGTIVNRAKLNTGKMSTQPTDIRIGLKNEPNMSVSGQVVDDGKIMWDMEVSVQDDRIYSHNNMSNFAILLPNGMKPLNMPAYQWYTPSVYSPSAWVYYWDGTTFSNNFSVPSAPATRDQLEAAGFSGLEVPSGYTAYCMSNTRPLMSRYIKDGKIRLRFLTAGVPENGSIDELPIKIAFIPSFSMGTISSFSGSQQFIVETLGEGTATETSAVKYGQKIASSDPDRLAQRWTVVGTVPNGGKTACFSFQDTFSTFKIGEHMILAGARIHITKAGESQPEEVALTASQLEDFMYQSSVSGEIGDGTFRIWKTTQVTNLGFGFYITVNGFDMTSAVIELDTAFDYKAYLADNPTGLNGNAQVEVSNTIRDRTFSDTGTQRTSITSLYYDLTSELSVSKPIPIPVDGDRANTVKSYRVESTIGTAGASYLRLDDFISGFADIGADESAGAMQNDRAILDAIAKSAKIKDLVVKMSDPVANVEEIIFRGTASEDSDWEVLVPTMADPHNDAMLIWIKKRDGSLIPPETKFTVTYDMQLDMDGGSPALRQSDAYGGKQWMVVNNVKATAPVGASSAMPYVFADGEYGPYDNCIGTDGQATTLNCYAGAGAAGVYLSNPTGRKLLDAAATGGFDSSWKAVYYTGSAGKDTTADAVFFDSGEWKIPDSAFSGLDSDSAKALRDGLMTLLARHTSFNDVDVYCGSASTPSEFGIGPVAEFPGKVESAVTKATADDAHDVTVEPVSDTSFSVKMTDVPLDMYVEADYTVSLDWEPFFSAAVDAGLLDGFGNIAGTSNRFSAAFTNAIADADGKQLAHGGESKIDIASLDAGKTVLGTDGHGNALWRIDLTVGDVTSDTVSVRDALSELGASDGVEAGLAAAASYGAVVISVDGDVVYDEAEDDPYSDPYSADSISVSKSGSEMDVTVKSPDGKPYPVGTEISIEYATAIDPSKYVAASGVGTDDFTVRNIAQCSTAKAEASGHADVVVTPDYPVSVSKEAVDDGDATASSYKIVAESGAAGHREFKVSDLADVPEGLATSLELQGFKLTFAGTGFDGEYSLDSLPEGVVVTERGTGAAMQLGKPGSHSFDVTVDEMPADATMTIEYSLSVDREAYVATGWPTDVDYALANSCELSTQDGRGDTASAADEIHVPATVVKTGEMTGYTGDGNPMFTWTFRVELLADTTRDELDAADEVRLADHLPPVLRYVPGTVSVKDVSGAEPEPVPSSAYEVTTAGNAVYVTFSKPYDHTQMEIEFETEAIVTVDSISNTGYVEIDGKTWSSTEDHPGHFTVKRQYGAIRSATPATWAPWATKFIDGEPIDDPDHVFTFEAVEVDGDGKAVEGGYVSEAVNDEHGEIVFDEITYTSAGQHYYKLTETGVQAVEDDFDYDYLMDSREFVWSVLVAKAGTEYVAVADVVSPENYEAVLFDNAKVKTRDLSVEKDWDDGTASFRPASITVVLMNHGKPYGNLTATLNEANGWKHTFEALPVADGDYSVSELPVPGYAVEYADVVKQDGKWVAAIGNTATEPGALSISKEVVGEGADPDRMFAFDIVIGSDISGKFGDVTLTGGTGHVKLKAGETAVLLGLPDEASYTVSERDYSADGYFATSVTGAEGDIEGGETAKCKFVNSYLGPTSSKVVKEWDGDSVEDRPLSITAVLYRELPGGTREVVGEEILTAGNGWTAVVDDLPERDLNGAGCRYSWMEKTVPADYTLKGVEDKSDGTTVITNERTPGTPEQDMSGFIAKTGDMFPIAIGIALMGSLIAVAGGVAWRKKRNG